MWLRVAAQFFDQQREFLDIKLVHLCTMGCPRIFQIFQVVRASSLLA